MASASFWYYPDGLTLTEINLGRDLTELEGPWQVRDEDVTHSMAGTEGKITRSVRSECTVRVTGIIKGAAARVQLENFVAFARTGVTFAFAADRSKAAGAWLETVPSPGDTVLTHSGNDWQNFNLSAGLTTGDPIVIQSASPEYTWEETTVSTFTGTELTVQTALNRVFSASPVLGRHRDFWPFVRLARGSRSSTGLWVNKHRWTYVLDLHLEEDVGALGRITGVVSVPFAGVAEGSGQVGPYAGDDSKEAESFGPSDKDLVEQMMD